MSKNRLRAEKICLNCNTELYDRFCHKCGQENIEPKESAWHLVSHFFYDITHFDGKFFSTLKYLIKKPGFLSTEYIKGRRQSYLNPVRMYVFTSALFFLVFFSMFSMKTNAVKKGGFFFDEKDVDNLRSQTYERAETKEDSARIDSAFRLIQHATLLKKDTSNKKDSGDNKKRTKLETKSGLQVSGWLTEDEMTLAQYDSIQKTLPKDQKDNWLKGLIKRRVISLSERYKDNPNQFWSDLLNKFIHYFPYMLFISLPLYALYLKLLYIRRRKQFYYVDHGIFLVHLYIFTFIFMLFFFLVNELSHKFHWGWLDFIELALILYGIYYTFRSMRNFYKQGFFKTFIKFILLNLMAYVSLIILFGFFFVFSVFQL